MTAGNAVHIAAGQVREKILKVASAWLEVSTEDLELADGRVRVKGVPQMGRSLGEIAAALAGTPGYALPAGMAPGLAAGNDFQPPGLTYCNGTHVVEAEVDPATGVVRLTRYVVVHDSGRLINPMMVEGQIIGGVVHGIGAALYEWMIYDADGQPQTGTYADYLLSTADVVPRIEVHHMESPTPLNPLGIKGAGESGTIAAPAAVASAVEDALRPFGGADQRPADHAGAAVCAAARERAGAAVKPAPFAYHAPRSRDALFALLAEHGDSRVLAGGQSLVPLLNLRLAGPANLIDLQSVPGLAGIEADGMTLRVGAMTRQRAAEHSALAAQAAPCCARRCIMSGSSRRATAARSAAASRIWILRRNCPWSPAPPTPRCCSKPGKAAALWRSRTGRPATSRR